jgi:hypothetical protein
MWELGNEDRKGKLEGKSAIPTKLVNKSFLEMLKCLFPSALTG